MTQDYVVVRALALQIIEGPRYHFYRVADVSTDGRSVRLQSYGHYMRPGDAPYGADTAPFAAAKAMSPRIARPDHASVYLLWAGPDPGTLAGCFETANEDRDFWLELGVHPAPTDEGERQGFLRAKPDRQFVGVAPDAQGR